MTNLFQKPWTDVAGLIRQREISPVEYTQSLLERIHALNPKLHAFCLITPDIALAGARQAEQEISAGHYRGPLHGIPYALKDIIDYAGLATTANSRVLEKNVVHEDAHVTQRLKQAGAIFLGKLTTNEFACGGAPTGCPFPSPLNPWNARYITAGSSSGSAVAVAAQLVPLALGTDTNGSIRNPASRCGTVGMKPTYGRVSRRGVFPLSPSQDHVGPLTRTVRENACALQAIAGPDPLDATCRDLPVDDYLHELEAGVRGMRIGVVRNVYLDDPGADPEQVDAIDRAIEILAAAGAQIVELDLPGLDQYTAVARLLLSAEGYSIHEKWLKTTPELYGAGAKSRLLQGAFLSSANYLHAQRLRSRLSGQMSALMSQVDVMVTASCADATPLVDDAHAATQRHRHQVQMPFNVTGQPALVLPTGLSKKTGLPLSMQIAGHHFDEKTVYRTAYAYERVAGPLTLHL